MKSSPYYFYVMTKISADFQICISVPLNMKLWFFVNNKALFMQTLQKYTYKKKQNLLFI